MRFEGKTGLLHLAVLLSGSHEGLSIADVRREFDVSHRTAQRMMAAIRDRFPDCDEVEGDDRAKRWRLQQTALRGLMGAEAAELAELDAAARRLRDEGAAAGRAEALERLAAKLRAAMKLSDLRRAEPDVEALMQAEGTAIRPGPRPIVAAALLTAIRHAMLASHRMRLHYGADPMAAREHVVEPLGLLHGQRPYLVPQIVGTKQGASVFRLDRIREHTVLSDPFPRSGFQPSSLRQAILRRVAGGTVRRLPALLRVGRDGSGRLPLSRDAGAGTAGGRQPAGALHRRRGAGDVPAPRHLGGHGGSARARSAAAVPVGLGAQDG